MKTIMFIIGCLMLCTTHIQASTNHNIDAPTWQSAFAVLKIKVNERNVNCKPPIYTEIMRHNHPSQKIVMDVRGVKRLTLYTDATSDGTNYDHAAFASPRLVNAKGEVTYLTDLRHVSAKAPYNSPMFNVNYSGQKIIINGKQHDKGIMLHADGFIAYNLDNKYDKFEVEVGIDDNGTNSSSVIFKFVGAYFNVEEIVKDLYPEYQQSILSFVNATGTSLHDLLAVFDVSVEKTILNKTIADFKDKSYYLQKAAEYDKLPIEQQIEKYVELISTALKVRNLNSNLSWISTKAMSMYLDDMKQTDGFDYAKHKVSYDNLVGIVESLKAELATGNPENIDRGEDLVRSYKEIMFANPLLDDDKIVVARFNLSETARTAMGPQIGTAPSNWTSMYSAKKRGFDAEVTMLSNLRGQIKLETIYKPTNGENIADLQMHWDADKLLFSSVDENDKWHIYEVGVDGENFGRKINLLETDVEFCDANYLADGRVIASSNIGYQGVPCVDGGDKVGNLTIYNPKNGNFRRLTFDQDGNWNPTVMNNGRVMYTRWEYTDLTHYFSRIIMHMNPDGTENKALYGSGSFWPNSTFDVKPLPGNSSQFIGIISGHHGVQRSGRLIIFDPVKSRKEVYGVVQELPFRDRNVIPEVKDHLVDGVWPQFLRPCPLNEKYFLVSAKLSPESLWGVYLVDIYDNLTCVAEFEGQGMNSPIMVTKKTLPPVIPDRVNVEDKDATIFIQDIYEGEGTVGIPRGEIKELRIFAYEYAYWKSVSDHDAQGIQSGWDIKRLLGTVPVEVDGSAIFKVPANTPISIQPVGGDGGALQWMRSWFTAMPGETVSCIGCHEDLNQIPIPKRTIASQRKPHSLKVPEGGVRSFTFDLEMQPILDRACIACHSDKSSINLKHRMDNEYPRAGHVWSKSYLEIMPYIYRQGPEADMYVLKPYEYHASNSELVRLLKTGHHGVELTDKEWRTLYNWIDFNAPYAGRFDNITEQGGFDQYERRIELANKYNNDAGIDWRKEIEDYAQYLRRQGGIKPMKPSEIEKSKYKNIKLLSWPFTKGEAVQMQNEVAQARKTVEIAPNIMMNFVWIPHGKFIMGNNNAQADCSPEFKAKVDKGFWMSECEVTNEQYCALVPEHDSRIIGQFWKDHTNAGYWANLPQQPVIRVSCNEAQTYCEELGAKSGLTMSLPTETQWEWAARAGSDTEFWYGNFNSDFGQYENMADTQLSNMAVIGVDPQPMTEDNSLRKYWDYIPKISAVDDGQMITTSAGQYKANPWGLKDIHGNVAEWTISDYVSYPIKKKETSEYKVARGGSWTDRPKYSTSYTRKAFLPWQKVYNVGFRVIITE